VPPIQHLLRRFIDDNTVDAPLSWELAGLGFIDENGGGPGAGRRKRQLRNDSRCGSRRSRGPESAPEALSGENRLAPRPCDMVCSLLMSSGLIMLSRFTVMASGMRQMF